MKKLIRNLAVHLALLSLVYTAFHPRALAQTAQRIRLEEGTQVRLKLMEPLTSATAKVGQVVSFEVLDEIRIGESLVIAEGAAAWGTVVEAEGKRYMGRAGKLALQIEYVKAVDGTKVPLRASDQASQGKGKGVACIDFDNVMHEQHLNDFEEIDWRVAMFKQDDCHQGDVPAVLRRIFVAHRPQSFSPNHFSLSVDMFQFVNFDDKGNLLFSIANDLIVSFDHIDSHELQVVYDYQVQSMISFYFSDLFSEVHHTETRCIIKK